MKKMSKACGIVFECNMMRTLTCFGRDAPAVADRNC